MVQDNHDSDINNYFVLIEEYKYIKDIDYHQSDFLDANLIEETGMFFLLLFCHFLLNNYFRYGDGISNVYMCYILPIFPWFGGQCHLSTFSFIYDFLWMNLLFMNVI